MRLFVLLSLTFLVSTPIASAKATSVVVQQVVTESSQQQVQAVGSAQAVRSVMLYPAVGDRVTAVHFTPGQEVKEGDSLVELDARQQKAALDEAQIRLADAQRTLARLKNSYDKGAIPKSELDDALTARDLAKVLVVKAQAELEDRTVRAPFSGVMGLTDVEVGDRITEQTAIASIDDTRALYVNFNAPEAALAMLRGGTQVSVEPWQGADKVTASIAQIDSRIDPQNRTIRVKAKIDNQDNTFLPGMSFRVYLQMKGAQYAVVPEAAMLWGATGPYVWKSVDNVATRVDVNIAQRLSGRLLVSGDLAPGELLIVEGIQRLRPNQEVAFEQIQIAQEY